VRSKVVLVHTTYSCSSLSLTLCNCRHITQADMREMLCTSDGKMDATVLKMWRDGLREIQSKSDDKITFEEFRRFLKGHAPKEVMLSSIRSSGASRRRSSQSLISAAFALQPVQRDSTATPKISREYKDKVRSFDDLYPVGPKSMATRAVSLVIHPPSSMLHDGDDDFDLPMMKRTKYLESDSFCEQHDFRMSVLHASKLFEKKREARHRLEPYRTARLSMVAGARRPSNRGQDVPVSVFEASKRSGRRNRYNRKKTVSDVLLLLRSIDSLKRD
jgi:hypothetical protein